jgi:hypothetical protein
MPVMNIIILFILLKHNVRIAFIELTMELGVLSDRLKLLNSVDFKFIFSGLSEESVSFSLEFLNVHVQFFSFHN